MRIISRRELIKELTNKGYKLSRSKGSHDIYKNDEGNNIVVPINLNPCIALRLAKEIGFR